MAERHSASEGQPGRKVTLIGRLFRLVGIYRPDAGWGIVLRRRFFLILLGLVVLLIIGGVWFTFDYSAKPEFCESCHLLKPYVESWRASSHNKVPCLTCHFPPGWKNYLRGKFLATRDLITTLGGGADTTKLHAEVEDAACLRGGCHETRLLQGKVLFKGKYHFDHGLHLNELRRGKKLQCTSCHSQIVQGRHIAVTESVCFICHFKGRIHDRLVNPVAGCDRCHEPPAQPIPLAADLVFKHQPYLDRKVPCWKCHFESVQGTGDVARQVCLDCHNEPDRLQRYDDSKFIHDWHVTRRKVECFQCHEEIRHGLHPVPYEREASCAVCHTDGHSPQASLFAGRGGKGVPDMPSRMFRANVDCVACHELPTAEEAGGPETMRTFRAGEQACLDCHGAGFKGMLAEWQKAAGDALAKAKAAVDRAQKAVAAMPDGDPKKEKAKTSLSAAVYNCEFVEKAHGVHNLDYAMELLDRATAGAAEAASLAGPPRPAEPAPAEPPAAPPEQGAAGTPN